MMSGSKKERNLSTCSQLSQKSSAHFCLFSKVRSASPPPGNTAVYLNVYDLTPVNGYVYWAGLGIFHSGIEGMMSQIHQHLLSEIKVLFATAFYRSPSRSMQSVMTQMAKLKIVRKEG